MPAQRHVVSSAVVVADQGGDGRIEVGRHIVGDLVDVPLDGLVITLQLAVGLRMDLSVAAQLRALRDYSRKNDYMVVRESVDEAESKRIACRPEFNKMIDEARMPKATFREILVWEFPRFAHKREHAASYKSMLGRKGVRVVSIAEHADDTPTGKLMEPIVESVHEFYSENLAQEVWRELRRGRLERSWNASGPPSRDRAATWRRSRGRREQAGHFDLGAAGRHLGDQLGSGHWAQARVRMARDGPPVTAEFRPRQQIQRGPSPVNTPLWELHLALWIGVCATCGFVGTVNVDAKIADCARGIIDRRGRSGHQGPLPKGQHGR